jgi:hypothetical protein
VIDRAQPVAARVAVHAREEFEVDVVDAAAVLEPVDLVERRAADALDRRQPQLHRAGGHVDGLRTELERAGVGLVRILHAERKRAGRRPMLGCEVAGEANSTISKPIRPIGISERSLVMGLPGTIGP